MVGRYSLNDRNPIWKLENPAPGEKAVQMILASLDAHAKVYPIANLIAEESGLSDCLVIDGWLKGHGHRVLIDGVTGPVKVSKERLSRLARDRKSCSADAGFFCMGSGTSGELLLLGLKLGLIPIEFDFERGSGRVHLGTATIVRHVSVPSWDLIVYASAKDRKGLSFDEKSEDLLFQGKPICNWLSRESRRLMQKAGQDCNLSVKYAFKKPAAFEFQGRGIDAERIEANFACRIQYRVHSLQADLADLEYNPRLRKVFWSGHVPRERKELARLSEMDPDEALLLAKNTTWKPELHVYHPVTVAAGPGFPDLAPQIRTTDISVRLS